MVSSTPRPQITPGIDPVPILQEAGWAPGPVWTGGKIIDMYLTEMQLFSQPRGCSIRHINSESLQTRLTQGKAIHPDVSPCYHGHDTING